MRGESDDTLDAVGCDLDAVSWYLVFTVATDENDSSCIAERFANAQSLAAA